MAAITTAEQRAIDLNAVRKQRSLWADAGYRLRRNVPAMAGLFIIVLTAVVAIAAPLLAPYDPIQQNTPIALSDPAWTQNQYVVAGHPFGTDALGRDTLSRLIYGARVSMVVGIVPTFLVFTIGISIGMLSGFKGGWVDNLLMRFTDIVYAFPDLLFLIIIVGTLRDTGLGNLLGGLVLIFAALAVVGWVGLARLIRGQVLSLKEKEFIEGGTLDRRATGPDHVPPPVPQHAGADHRGPRVLDPGRHSRGGRARVPRHRDQTADADLGRHDQRRVRRLLGHALAGLPSGDLHLGGYAVLYLPRRRPAGRARSADEALVPRAANPLSHGHEAGRVDCAT